MAYANYSASFCENKIDSAITELSDLKSRLEKHYSEMDIVNVESRNKIRDGIDNMLSTLDIWISNLEDSKQNLRK